MQDGGRALSSADAPNKVAATKIWLSREEYSFWLLIFDNANDLESISLSKSFLASFGGYIIIMSRDGAAISSVGQWGSVMEGLAAEEVVKVFHDKN